MVMVVVMMVQVRRLMLLRLLLMRHTGLRDLLLPVGAQLGPEAPRGVIHPSKPPVAVLHRAQNIGDWEGSGVLWAEGHGADTPCALCWMWSGRSGPGGSACVPLPPSGFLLLAPPWEEVQLIGCGRRRVALIPPDSDSNTWRGGATRTRQAANNADWHYRRKRRECFGPTFFLRWWCLLWAAIRNEDEETLQNSPMSLRLFRVLDFITLNLLNNL